MGRKHVSVFSKLPMTSGFLTECVSCYYISQSIICVILIIDVVFVLPKKAFLFTISPIVVNFKI